MDFPYLKFNDYKVIGEKYLKDHPYGINVLPTDIEILITKSGYVLESEIDLYKNFGVKGGVGKSLISNDRFKIYIDQNHYENQEFEYRFTLAEELSHIILHSKLYNDVKNLDDFIKKYNLFTDEQYKIFEQQAKCLASRLLLPQDKFEPFVLNWVNENISNLRKVKFYSKEILSRRIAIPISKKLKISEYVIDISLRRYPGCIIDTILDKYGLSLIQ